MIPQRNYEHKPQNIVDNFYFVERGWLNANHFVFNGNNKVLMDTGYKKHLDETFYLIKQTGLDPAKVELIISTHGHCDHIGGNNAIYDLSGCAIAMHSIDQYHKQVTARDGGFCFSLKIT